MRRAALAAAVVALAGCGGADIDVPEADASADAASADRGRGDVGSADVARAEVGIPDVVRLDVGTPDVGTPDVGTPDAGAPDASPVDTGPPPEPLFAAIPWSAPGYGVAYRDSQNPRGNDVFIGYGGYGVQAAWAQQWVAQLFRDALHDRGVRHVYAVQGPREAGYDSQEIGNSRLIAHLLPRLAPGARILVAAHSSGSFVAHELFGQLYQRGLDPTRATAGRVSYWDLDGASYGLNATIVGQLQHAWFVWANDAPRATRSPNASVMISAGATYAAAGGALLLDASEAGCDRGAPWCLHMAPITTRPHNSAGTSVALDYGAFDATHRVESAWLTRTNFGAP